VRAVNFVQTYAKELLSVVVPIFTAVFRWATRQRVKLIFATPHEFTFIIQEPLRDPQGTVVRETQTLKTKSFYFRNEGRATAHHVELVFNWKPVTLNIWPVRHFTEHTEGDRRYVMIFDTLAPGETFGCELLAINAETPNLITFRCDEGVGQSVPMYPQRVVSKGLVRFAQAMILIGIAASVYIVIAGLQWLILKTPTL
jgi:hypothetical protein